MAGNCVRLYSSRSYALHDILIALEEQLSLSISYSFISLRSSSVRGCYQMPCRDLPPKSSFEKYDFLGKPRELFSQTDFNLHDISIMFA